ncbi:MAG: MogA/MoaB family molybdenum cofactor biosynthesis protein [Candidatus Verstraetearchaeota archaeon]|nr:MogA/MoaB family molybdenum cofactor biosynthesis protein [Candidatus Verstraetearchaeota archaeon]
MGDAEHRRKSPESLGVAVITVSDSRAAAVREGKDEDISGRIIEERLREAGHSPIRAIIPDEEDQIKRAIEKFTSDKNTEVIITTGGTGVTSRDRTVDVVRSFFDKEFPGFGEILRRKGYEMVGLRALFTRATAGIKDRKLIFCLPGTPNSVKVAMDIILPDLTHLVRQARE